jgi:membrane-bound inhibitor of C-type lysozyme
VSAVVDRRLPVHRLTVLWVAAALGHAGIAAAQQAGSPIEAMFACAGGKQIQAIFVNGAHPTVELTLSDGRHLLLPQAVSASGARYANADESFVFWNVGRTAFVEEAGQRTFSECVQKK